MGHYWASAFVSYASACADFILEDPEAQLSVYSSTTNETITIPQVVLKEVLIELGSLSKTHSRSSVENWKKDTGKQDAEKEGKP